MRTWQISKRYKFMLDGRGITFVLKCAKYGGDKATVRCAVWGHSQWGGKDAVTGILCAGSTRGSLPSKAERFILVIRTMLIGQDHPACVRERPYSSPFLRKDRDYLPVEKTGTLSFWGETSDGDYHRRAERSDADVIRAASITPCSWKDYTSKLRIKNRFGITPARAGKD